MPLREGPAQTAPPHQESGRQTFSADQARGGEVILRRRSQRIVFVAGLVGVVVLMLLIRLMAGA